MMISNTRNHNHHPKSPSSGALIFLIIVIALQVSLTWTENGETRTGDGGHYSVFNQSLSNDDSAIFVDWTLNNESDTFQNAGGSTVIGFNDPTDPIESATIAERQIRPPLPYGLFGHYKTIGHRDSRIPARARPTAQPRFDHLNLFKKLANWQKSSRGDIRTIPSTTRTTAAVSIATLAGTKQKYPSSTSFHPDLNAVCWSDDQSPNIGNIYRTQKESHRLYHNLCGTRFIKLFRLNQTIPSSTADSSKDILLFGSIYPSNSNQIRMDLVSRLAATADTEFEYFLVIRVNFSRLANHRETTYRAKPNQKNGKHLTVKVDQVIYQIYLDNNHNNESHLLESSANSSSTTNNLSGKVVEFLVPKHFSHKQIPMIEVVNRSDSDLIADSYVMICLRHQVSSAGPAPSISSTDSSQAQLPSMRCWPQAYGKKISCYCVEVNHRGYVYVCVALALVLVAIIGLVVYTVCTKSIQEPEVQFNLILCMPGHSSHEYLVIFRVGPASETFNYDASYIDFQLLGPQDEQIGIPVRFSCKYLYGHLFGEMHMFVGRISPIPLVHGIVANHSHANNLIFFYDFTVIDLHDNNEIVQEESVNQYIVNEPHVFRPQSSVDLDDQNNMMGQRRRLQNLMATRLNELEFIAIIAFVLGFIACMVMVLNRYFHFFSNWHNTTQTWIQIAVTVVLIAVFSWSLIFIIELLYKYVIKSNYIDESYKQLITDSTGNGHKILWVIWILLLYLCGLLFCIGTVILSLQVDFIAIFWWSGVVALISALVFGLWLCLELYSLFKMMFSCCNELVTQDGFERSCSEDLLNHHASSSSGHNSMFIQMSKKDKTISSINCMFEPKMVNPNLVSKNSTGSGGPSLGGVGGGGSTSAAIIAAVGTKNRFANNKANMNKGKFGQKGSKTTVQGSQQQLTTAGNKTTGSTGSRDRVAAASSSSSILAVPTDSSSQMTLVQQQSSQQQQHPNRSKTKFKQQPKTPGLNIESLVLSPGGAGSTASAVPSGGTNNTNTFKNLLNKIVMNSKKGANAGGAGSSVNSTTSGTSTTNNR